MPPSKYRMFHSKCEKCLSTSNLIVHHKDANRRNNTLDNFEVLCKSCHAIVHKRITNIIRMRIFYATHKYQLTFDFYSNN